MATITSTHNPNANTPLEKNPNKTLDPTLPLTAKPDPDPYEHPTHPASDASPTTDKEASAEAGPDSPLSDIQKKKRRAERFGISVQLSEQEKRNSRAERFGTGSTLQSSEASKSEELKRKARAERFGMPSPSMAVDEDAKKKARLARFAPVSKTDPLEEDKRKARVLRFSNPSSDIAGKAGGGA